MPGTLGDLHDRRLERRPVDDHRGDGRRHDAGCSLPASPGRARPRPVRRARPPAPVRSTPRSPCWPAARRPTRSPARSQPARPARWPTRRRIALPGGTTDPTPANNSATDTDTLTPTADLSITKTDGVDDGGAGDIGDLHDRGHQRGPSTVTAATVDRHVPGRAHRRDVDLRRQAAGRPARPVAAATSTPRSICRSAAR